MAVVFAGCNGSLWDNSPWKNIDKSETDASRYGTVAVGAPRIADYDNAELEASRERLREAIGKLRKEVDGTLTPELASARWSERARDFKLGVDLGSLLTLPAPTRGDNPGPGNPPTKDADATTANSLDALKGLLQGMSVAPNPIDAQIYKLSVLRFLESELDSLNLNRSSPVDSTHYRRIQVTVSLTAWTTPPAASALVYLDLYPYKGDVFCHETANDSIKAKTKAKKDAKGDKKKEDKALREALPGIARDAGDKLGKAFSYSDPLSNQDLWEWLKSKTDTYTSCHRWFMDHHLLPKLVHVEPLGDSRFVMINQGETTAHDVGVDMRAGTYGSLRAGQEGSDAGLTKNADIQLTSISFAAGAARAGWLFRGPTGSTASTPMRPLERRLRMVVDIPKHLKDLELHVHKSFLNDENTNLTPYSQHTEGLRRTRWLLDDIEKDLDACPGEDSAISYREKCYPSDTHWQLSKSRVRNLLSLWWSERLVVHVPESAEQKIRYVVHANVVSPDGASNQFLIIDGDRINKVVREQSALPDGYLREVDVSEDYVYPGFIDTHNHPHYNFIPQWLPSTPAHSQESCNPYCNRYQWQDETSYKDSVKQAYDTLDDSGYGIDGLRYGHLRALAGGVTTIQGGHDPGQQPTQLRTLWKYSESSTKRVSELRDSGQLRKYKAALDGKEIKRLFLHVAEGIDAQSKDELLILEQEGLLRPEVVLIHAIPFGAEELDKIKKHNMTLVWSPRSNLTLYGQTMDIKQVIQKEITVALAPDWTITGSSNMLQELKCAREYADINGLNNITNQKLYDMVTEMAAHIAGLEQDGQLLGGKLAPNTYADFVVIKKKKDNPFDNLLAVTEEDIRLIVIGGQPVLGEPKIFSRVSSDFPVDFVTIGNSVKAVRLLPKRQSDAYSTSSIPLIQHRLAQTWPLAPIRESPSKSCAVRMESH